MPLLVFIFSASTYGFLSLIFKFGDLERSSAWSPVYKDLNLHLKRVECSKAKAYVWEIRLTVSIWIACQANTPSRVNHTRDVT